ncbi:MAG: hypothetical protein RJB12_1335, partial [Pseudomonadota bacterium]
PGHGPDPAGCPGLGRFAVGGDVAGVVGAVAGFILQPRRTSDD